MAIYQFTLPNYKHSDIFTSIGNGEIVNFLNIPLKEFALQVEATGIVTSWSVTLQISLDGVNFTDLMTHTELIGSNIILYSSSKTAATHFRLNCNKLNLGLGTNIKVTAIGSN